MTSNKLKQTYRMKNIKVNIYFVDFLQTIFPFIDAGYFRHCYRHDFHYYYR
jgi:hypothetical protein